VKMLGLYSLRAPSLQNPTALQARLRLRATCLMDNMSESSANAVLLGERTRIRQLYQLYKDRSGVKHGLERYEMCCRFK
jgi:hypothetical protein